MLSTLKLTDSDSVKLHMMYGCQAMRNLGSASDARPAGYRRAHLPPHSAPTSLARSYLSQEIAPELHRMAPQRAPLFSCNMLRNDIAPMFLCNSK
eukprot:4748160-Amphidinium_carterae.1